MAKLTRLTKSDLNEMQRAVWGEITNGPRSQSLNLVAGDGALVGPFNASLHRPAVGMGLVRAGEAIRFSNTLPTDLLEIAICTVGAHWKAEFEWWAHSRLARDAGVSNDVLEAIRTRSTPDFGDDERAATVYRYARSLLETGRPTAEIDVKAAELLSEAQLVDLVSAIGYYCYISFSLNAFEVALPEGIEPFFS